MPDSSDVDAALVALLAGDAALMELCPDGVFMDIAPSGKTKFVIVSLVIAQDEPMFGGRAYEDLLYLVKAMDQSTSGVSVKAAAARIDALLEHQTLTVTGYSHMAMYRTERFRELEVDPSDGDTRWQHRGGRYLVVVSA